MSSPLSTGLAQRLSTTQASFALLAGALVLTAIVAGPLILIDHPRDAPIDFHHLWTGGRAWALLTSPYADDRAMLFAQYGLPHLYDEPPPFFYPPHSVVLFGPLGALPPGTASIAMMALSLAALALSSVLAADLWRGAGLGGSRLAIASAHAVIVIACWNAGAVILFHNIATLIVYAALMAILRGAQISNQTLIATGVFTALISPQMSIAAVIALMMLPKARPGAALGLLAVALLSLIGLAPGGVIASLGGFLGNIAAYTHYPANSHFAQSGIGFFIANGLGVSLHSGVLLAACAVALISMRYFWTLSETRSAKDPVAFLCLAIAAGLFFLPSLNHYYIAVTPAVVLLALRPGLARWFALAAALLLMRSWDFRAAIEQFTALEGASINAAIDSIGISLLACAAAASWRPRERQAPAFYDAI